MQETKSKTAREREGVYEVTERGEENWSTKHRRRMKVGVKRIVNRMPLMMIGIR